MQISKINQSVLFKGIAIDQDGLNYIKNEGGEVAIRKLFVARDEFANSKWELNISKNGYTLKSPTTKKTYAGPFSIKRSSKTGAERKETSQLIIRMDERNRAKYTVKFKDMFGVRQMYKAIKNSKGLDKMLLLLAALEGHIKL